MLLHAGHYENLPVHWRDRVQDAKALQQIGIGSTEWRVTGAPSKQRCLLMTEAHLHEKNLLFFTSACPPIAESVRVRETELTQPIFDDAGDVVDIDIGHTRLYNRPAAEFAAEQVDSAQTRPGGLLSTSPGRCQAQGAGSPGREPPRRSSRRRSPG